MSSPSTIQIESVVSAQSFEPFVQLKWGKEAGQLTVAEAREHAFKILEGANAAEMDALLVRFLRERIGVEDPNMIGGILADFRKLRGL